MLEHTLHGREWADERSEDAMPTFLALAGNTENERRTNKDVDERQAMVKSEVFNQYGRAEGHEE